MSGSEVVGGGNPNLSNLSALSVQLQAADKPKVQYNIATGTFTVGDKEYKVTKFADLPPRGKLNPEQVKYITALLEKVLAQAGMEESFKTMSEVKVTVNPGKDNAQSSSAMIGGKDQSGKDIAEQEVKFLDADAKEISDLFATAIKSSVTTTPPKEQTTDARQMEHKFGAEQHQHTVERQLQRHSALGQTPKTDAKLEGEQKQKQSELKHQNALRNLFDQQADSVSNLVTVTPAPPSQTPKEQLENMYLACSNANTQIKDGLLNLNGLGKNDQNLAVYTAYKTNVSRTATIEKMRKLNESLGSHTDKISSLDLDSRSNGIENAARSLTLGRGSKKRISSLKKGVVILGNNKGNIQIDPGKLSDQRAVTGARQILGHLMIRALVLGEKDVRKDANAIIKKLNLTGKDNVFSKALFKDQGFEGLFDAFQYSNRQTKE